MAESKKFTYKTFIKWEKERRGLLSSEGKPYLEVATPPEFKGHPGIWTPEDLLVASVNSCIMTTFLFLAYRKEVQFLSYESEAEGTLEKVDNTFMISRINVFPVVLVKKEEDIPQVRELIAQADRTCLITNSLKSKVEVLPEVKTG